MGKIAIIGAGPMAKIVAEKAKKKSVETHCFAWTDGAVADKFVDYYYPISIFEKEQIVEICKKIGVDGVVATTEITISIAAYVANAMGLNTNNQEVADNITKKYWVREKVNGAKSISICQPKYKYVSDATEVVMTDMFPVVVKPVSEGGKRGVTVANTETEFLSAIRYAFQADRKNNGVLIEEYLKGTAEYSVESISFHGEHQIIQVTQKISSGPPHCVELGHSQPADISNKIKANITLAIAEVLDAVGLTDGPTHCEIKLVDDKIYLIELNARPGGDHIAFPLTELSTGYDYIGAIIDSAMGIAPPIMEKSRNRYAGIRFITQQTERLKSIFDTCDNERWLYLKHTEPTVTELTHNDGYHTNYFIYCSDDHPDFLEIKE